MIHERLEEIRDPDNIEKYYQDYVFTENLPEIWGVKAFVKVPSQKV